MNPCDVIPARLAATRLPGKPLAEIAGVPMIVQGWRRAREAGLGPVIVAAGDREIVEAVTVAGGTAVLTDPDHPSGSDRIFEAVERIDPGGRYDVVVNVQRSEEHTSELQSLMRISYAVFCLNTKKKHPTDSPN